MSFLNIEEVKEVKKLQQKLQKEKVFLKLLNFTMGLNQTTINSFGNKNDPYFKKIYTSFEKSIALESNVPEWVLNLDGLSGKKYRHMINNLIALIKKPRYLEIGSWKGSTSCAAAIENILCITCIDDWSEKFEGRSWGYVENPEKVFKNNIKKCIDKETKFKLIKKDFRSVNYKELGKYNLYLFDGPHHEKDQYDALTFVHTALEKKFILIVDDWNWDQVRLGTNKAIQDLNFKIIAGLEIMTTHNSSSAYVQGQNSEWHNGYGFFVIEK